MRKILSCIIIATAFFCISIDTVSAAVAARSFATKTFSTTVNTTVNKPAGTVDNDIMVMGILITSGVAITPPAGWNTYTGSPFTGSHIPGFNESYYWKRASSEGSSWTWTHASADNEAMVISYSGAITTGDPNDATLSYNVGNSANITGTAITTATDSSLAIMLWQTDFNAITFPPPSGWLEHGDANVTYGAIDKTISPAGSTGTPVIACGASGNWSAFMTALKVAPAASSSKTLAALGVG